MKKQDEAAKMPIKMQARASGRGAPLVLVPGGLTGWASWEPFVEQLSGSHRVLSVQLLAVQYGLEDRPLPAEYSVKTESGALLAALTEADVQKPADIVAWSYGALISLDYALDHIERIRTLTLIEPPALWVLHASGYMDEELRAHEALVRSFHGDVSEDQLAEFLCTVGICPPGKTARDLPQWANWVKYKQSLRQGPAVPEHKDDPRRLRTLQRPVLLVKGTGSAGFLHRIIDLLAAELPDARVVEMPGGHTPHIVSRDRFFRETASFHRGSTSGG